MFQTRRFSSLHECIAKAYMTPDSFDASTGASVSPVSSLTESLSTSGLADMPCGKKSRILRGNLEHCMQKFVESIESRFERQFLSEVQSLTSRCEQRLQAKEDHLHRIISGLETKIDCFSERMNRRLAELENFATNQPSWRCEVQGLHEGFARLQLQLQTQERRLQQCLLSDDFIDRSLEMENTASKRWDDQLAIFEQQFRDHCNCLDKKCMEVMSQQCKELEERITHEKGPDNPFICAADVGVKRLSESGSPICEFREILCENAKTAELCQQRLNSHDAMVAKIPVIETKVQLIEALAKEQFEDYTNASRRMADILQQVSADLAGTQQLEAETSRRRDVAQNAFESRILNHVEEATHRIDVLDLGNSEIRACRLQVEHLDDLMEQCNLCMRECLELNLDRGGSEPCCLQTKQVSTLVTAESNSFRTEQTDHANCCTNKLDLLRGRCDGSQVCHDEKEEERSQWALSLYP